jgi:hypothetical protein
MSWKFCRVIKLTNSEVDPLRIRSKCFGPADTSNDLRNPASNAITAINTKTLSAAASAVIKVVMRRTRRFRKL